MIEYLTADEAAARLKLKKNTVYMMASRGEIESVRVGRKALRIVARDGVIGRGA